MNLTKKTIFFISGFIFSVLFFGLAGGVQAQTACPSATTPGLLLCEDFEDNSWSDSFDGTFNPENVSIVSFSSAQSGSRVARMYGGYLGAAFDYNVSVSEGDEFYIKYYVYYPADWTWSGISDTNMKQFRAQGSNGYPIFVYQKDGAGGVRTFGGFSGYAGSGVCSDPTWYGPASTPSLSSWHKVEMFVRYASSGGGYWWKVDDNYVSQYNGTLDCDTFPSADGAINNLRIAGGNGFPEGDFYYVDNMEIWDRLPSSSGTQTCSNCCTSSQTCPTAFTTVGTCTRCCSTACQTALTDTTAPRVTAFTITPTTLTVGASLTANYTVTDNTALARAELWRAPSGTNCTDTVKTGCVWTQVTSANITGTSRTGTFTSSPTAAGTFYYGLHAVDAAGNIGYESAAVRVTVNAQTQTCTNCCSTTQTCPTAMTTVGTCTRCCATTCQTVTSGSPVINSISGNIFNNSPITISGSGFGAKTVAAPVLWDRVDNISSYSNLTNGATIPVGGSNPWPSPYGNSSGDGLVKYNTSDTQRGISTAQYKATNAVAGYLDGLTWTATNYAYVSWWWKQDRDVSGGDHSSKFLRMSNVSDETGKTFSFTQMANYVYGPDGYCQNSGGLQWDGWGGNANSWNFIETWFNSSNRTYTIRINGQELSNNISWSGCSAFSFNELWKIGFDGGGTNPPAITWWMDDIYVDNTFSRVMLGNASTYSASTHLEMQTPTAWSTNSVTINANQGSFTPGQTAYLYIIDANGNASNGYPVTIGGGPSATCSNCCSTTQTCPTAFTTVGTCTRCCASTCQTTSACGNGNCETGETCSSCASDCGACPGGQCQKIASGAAIPAGYGAPYNTLSSSGEQLMNVVCNANSASVSIGNNSTSQYIYRYGYIWRNNAWQRIDLTGSVPAYEGNWFRGNATATVSLTATELTQENNLIAYICTWNGTAWRCGCRDSACTTPYWQLQRFGNY